jgi:hypothetical protein
MRVLVPTALLLCLSPFGTADATAKPKGITFAALIEKSPTIVVAKLTALPNRDKHRATLAVQQVLRGDLKPGAHEVGFEDFPFVAANQELVAFLDDQNVWRFAATPVAGARTVDRAVLKLRGFYDYNAYVVVPGVVTLGQLQAYLKGQALTYHFRGDLYFPQHGEADWKAGTITLTGSYEAVTENTTVTGLPKPQGFQPQPKVTVGWWGEPAIELDFTGAGRPLHLRGGVHGLDEKTGALLVRFAVTRPEVVTEADFRAYLADPLKGSSFTTFHLNCTSLKDKTPRTLKLTMGKWLGNSWDSLQLEGWDPKPLHILSMQYYGPDVHYGGRFYQAGENPFPKAVDQELDRKDGVLRLAAKTASGESLILAFRLGGSFHVEGPFTWSFRTELLYNLYRRDAQGTVYTSDGVNVTPVARFTTAFGAVGFNRRE